MVSLACTEHPHFVPSLAEAGEDFSGTQLHYSVDTVRYFRHVYHGDRLFFIIGADAFLDIPMWKEYETLLTLCDFIIANRPGIRPEALRLVIPPDAIARPDAKKEAEPPSQVVAQLHKTTIYLLENVSSDVSATEVRRHAHRGQSIHGLVSARVEEYILKQGLYLCTGFSTPQVQAICTEIEGQLHKSLGRSPEHREGHRSAEWALLDFGGFVVHVFSEQARRYYDLERLWRMAPKLEIPDAREAIRTGSFSSDSRASNDL